MTTGSAIRSDADIGAARPARRLTTETKHSSKTTELYAMVLAIAGILIACWYVGRDDANDPFRAEQAWLYVSIVVGAYLISRGLAKSGSREPYWDENDGNR
jgi:hypothetical protein